MSKTCETCRWLQTVEPPPWAILQNATSYRCSWADMKRKLPYWVGFRAHIENPWNEKFCNTWEEKK